jgi:hypothetical protein
MQWWRGRDAAKVGKRECHTAEQMTSITEPDPDVAGPRSALQTSFTFDSGTGQRKTYTVGQQPQHERGASFSS